MTTLQVIVNVAVLAGLIGVLYWLKVRKVSFSWRVVAGLAFGILFGLGLYAVYGPESDVQRASLEWVNLVGSGYVRLLQMLVIPLVFISIVAAFTRLELTQNIGKISVLIIGLLVGTATVAALLGIGATALFGLESFHIEQGPAELARAQQLQSTASSVQNQSYAARILELLPTNPFQDFTGARRTSTIAVVIFAGFVGLAYLSLRRRDEAAAEHFARLVEALYGIVMGMVRIVIRLTPYGVMALMTRFMATSNYQAIWQLGKFVAASYVALLAMFGIHLLLQALVGLNPAAYVKKTLPVLSFAFVSRSSAATLPLTVRAMTDELGVSKGIANFAGSFGLSIGQNGCAGVYPAMLAVMIAPTVGIDPFTPTFILSVLAAVAISSFGVAGVGGGATYAAILVLSLLDLPVGLAGLLISVEPLIDMGRTALNVSGSLTAGVLTARFTRQLDARVYAAPSAGVGTHA